MVKDKFSFEPEGRVHALKGHPAQALELALCQKDLGVRLDSLAVGKAQHLVVIQHLAKAHTRASTHRHQSGAGRVHVLNPDGIHRPIKDDLGGRRCPALELAILQGELLRMAHAFAPRQLPTFCCRKCHSRPHAPVKRPWQGSSRV